MSELNRGVLLGASAYAMWGVSTLYWPLLSSSGAVEILAHRMVWSLLAVVVLLAVGRNWRWISEVLRTPRQLLILAGAAAVISVNWGSFIYTVNSAHPSQAALGYFINPLVSVTLGVVIFSERLRRPQWVAVALGALAVAVLTYAYGAVPWMSLVMASSFATYGVLKKFTTLDGVQSLTVETLLMFLPALGYVAFLQSTGQGTFGAGSPAHDLLLVGSGVVTALPLVAFGAAARRIPLTLIGLLQFMVPVMQFLFAWLVFAEELPPSRWVGFAIVWVALAVFAVDLVRNAGNRASRPADRAAPERSSS
ncbi:chloramphenicol-sensitive protein RarD [Haloactinospora alba]|uniref:Chloramphenicol-sensitive protein RarD n=1 Tax=Haloactinospora alba TaxID=405555 RepID=A0A543NMN7_9ACTN|nr:EamA family transporter RarD [Haloactinospora alba]TQN33095.1 chloramphenicol-sensitive protein RarD [Haloactinospora alba]